MIDFLFGKRARAKRLLGKAGGRKIRVHSVRTEGGIIRIAFEFLDPPGPWSIQFYEADPRQAALIATLVPGTAAKFWESPDGARTRVMATEAGEPVWPR